MEKLIDFLYAKREDYKNDFVKTSNAVSIITAEVFDELIKDIEKGVFDEQQTKRQ